MKMRLMESSRSERGNTMVEAALTALVFFMLLWGIVGFARAMWGYSWASHAAREASRWASVRGKASQHKVSATDVDAYVKANNLGLTTGNITTNTVWDDPNETPGTVVNVTVSYNVSHIVPFVPRLTVSSTSRMVIAQ